MSDLWGLLCRAMSVLLLPILMFDVLWLEEVEEVKLSLQVMLESSLSMKMEISRAEVSLRWRGG